MASLNLEIAAKYENVLEKLYIAVTVEALLFEAALIGLLCYFLKFSTFALMQGIGLTLLVLAVASAVLWVRKKRIKNSMLKDYEGEGVDEAAFVAYLEANPLEFELLRALFISPKKH